MAKHDQRGTKMGICPDCLRQMYSNQRTVVIPVRIEGQWYSVLVHLECADRDR